MIDCVCIHGSVYGPRAGRDRSVQQAVALHTRVCTHQACTLVHTLHTVAADRGHGRVSEPCQQQQQQQRQRQRGGCKLQEFESKGGPARASSAFFSPSPSRCEIAHELRTNLLASHSLNSFQLASTQPSLWLSSSHHRPPSPSSAPPPHDTTRHETSHLLCECARARPRPTRPLANLRPAASRASHARALLRFACAAAAPGPRSSDPAGPTLLFPHACPPCRPSPY